MEHGWPMNDTLRSSPPGILPDSSLAGIRLLLAEDNEINQIITARLLKKAGAQVVVVNHGGEALERLPLGLDGQPFDPALLDVEMPELDGCEAARRIRADPRFRTLPIIALTAHSALEDRQRCLDAGMNDHLAKPINPDRLFATLRRWLPQSPDATAQPPTVALTAESASALPELTGLLDTVAGLKRAGGDHTLYRSLLARYAAGESDALAQIQAALIAGDLAMAERLAHTLKGVSGAIGAITVQGLAAALEQALRQRAGWAGVDPLLVQAGATLAELITALQAAPLTEPTLAAAAVRQAALASILKRLEVLLRDDDTEAIIDHRQTLAGALPEASFAALVQAVVNYDFAEALRRLGTFNLLEADGYERE